MTINKIEYISAILSLVSLALTIITRLTTLFPDLTIHITFLLIVSTVMFMFFTGYIGFSKKEGKFSKVYSYSSKKRKISKIMFLITPIISFLIWFNFIRLTNDEIVKRDRLVKLGNSYYEKEHLRSLALEPYRNALKIDPGQPEIIKRVKKLEQ